ncbi:transport and Golgi organization protein 11-like isoform X1 [Penaeus japonicus]|uniref:transport and Golgi organization protein 11-like isoform X1 n=1 Tax=Penaeus japonicus TaxID=27405 RepID=UPI001C71574C|nr:transport and Golgi organization protein 11-like isoform X1 [Penaeus japonicus]XP_042863238.1 transport and Golgi organization protein 11-like isoform X1 [Penaeus japonicus]XP_042863239.1 transport and Golgi organization protein 11-like isoform X1 [Penaeus japonicus]XP_042863240.1 transport and Golgi organization protein 11-like isoform X1 [Penaeus japonicus]XP_042863241.1 transport and Golgi organization protein 11-like isoform X1 [Penaeus japonicus]
MSNITSPQRFSGTFDHFYDGHYEADISTQMKVPKRIRVTGDNEDDPTVNWARYNGVNEKFEMSVPDRIVVAGMMSLPDKLTIAGGEQHIGTRGVPREVEVEKSIMPTPDPVQFRVQNVHHPSPEHLSWRTPPRTITLDSYNYPGVDDISPTEDKESSTPGSAPTILPRGSNSVLHAVSDLDLGRDTGTPGITTDLSPSEEISLLRRQVGRLNRRVMALELDTQQRAHREMIMYTLGVAYFLIKAILWINRN